MFRPRKHWNEREKTLLRKARWSAVGAFAVATCMHWTGGCASTGERWEDGVIESETTLPEMGSGPGSVVADNGDRPFLASEDSDAFRPEPLSDEPRTGRKNLFAAAPKPPTSSDAVMDLDAALPADAAPLLVPSGKSSLQAKLDEEKMKQDDARRSELVAENDRLLAEAAASLVPKAEKKVKASKKVRVAHHKAKKHPRTVRYAKRHTGKAKRHLASAERSTKAIPTIERWKPTLPPMVASTEVKPVVAEAAKVPVLASVGAPLAAPAKPQPPTTTTTGTKKDPKLASAAIGSAFGRHLGLLLMGVGALVLMVLFFLRKSRRDNEPMDW